MNSGSCPFLDLDLSIDSKGELSWKTYSKPLNAFLYVPRNSCHPTNTFSSIIQGEVKRLGRTNKSRRDFEVAVKSFSARLRKRGYSQAEIDRSIQKATRKPKAQKERNSNVYLGLRFTHTLRLKSVKRTLAKLSPLIKHRVDIAF